MEKITKKIFKLIYIKKISYFIVVVFYSGSSGCPLPLSANVTTANAIATPIAEPNAAISASAMVGID